MIRIPKMVIEELPFDLDAAVKEHAAAVIAHKDTEGVPAPMAHALVEAIVAAGGDYEIVEPPRIPTPAEAAAKAMSSAGGA